MGNMILLTILTVFSMNLFHFSYCGGGIREVFLSFDAILLKSAVSIRNSNKKLSELGETVQPYFNETLSVRTVEDYFEANLSPYLKGPNGGYRVKFYFDAYSTYYPSSGKVEAFPQIFSFQLEASFGGIYTFCDHKTFHIIEGASHD